MIFNARHAWVMGGDVARALWRRVRCRLKNEIWPGMSLARPGMGL